MLRAMVAELLHAQLSDIDPQTRFLDMGADSIVWSMLCAESAITSA